MKWQKLDGFCLNLLSGTSIPFQPLYNNDSCSPFFSHPVILALKITFTAICFGETWKKVESFCLNSLPNNRLKTILVTVKVLKWYSSWRNHLWRWRLIRRWPRNFFVGVTVDCQQMVFSGVRTTLYSIWWIRALMH